VIGVLDVKVPGRTLGHLIMAFLLSALGGYWLGAASPDTALDAVQTIIEQLGPISDSSFHNFVKIFTNNSMVAFLTFLSGLLFGLGPWFIMAFNGFVVGLVVFAVHRMSGMSMGQIILGLVPHGIVEIPAIALAGVAGIVWYREIISGEGRGEERFKTGAVKGLKLFILSVLLLFVAALIEAYVTPRVAGL